MFKKNLTNDDITRVITKHLARKHTYCYLEKLSRKKRLDLMFIVTYELRKMTMCCLFSEPFSSSWKKHNQVHAKFGSYPVSSTTPDGSTSQAC